MLLPPARRLPLEDPRAVRLGVGEHAVGVPGLDLAACEKILIEGARCDRLPNRHDGLRRVIVREHTESAAARSSEDAG